MHKLMKGTAAGIIAAALAAAALSVQAAPAKKAPTASEVEACWEKAGDDADRGNACLKMELALVQEEYKSTTERVASLAKAWDKPDGGRTRWNKFIVAGQSFDTFVRRECEFVSSVTKGRRIVEDNAELACRIGWYRLRTSTLTNRHLTQSRY